jgi:hypothetical protein
MSITSKKFFLVTGGGTGALDGPLGGPLGPSGPSPGPLGPSCGPSCGTSLGPLGISLGALGALGSGNNQDYLFQSMFNH